MQGLTPGRQVHYVHPDTGAHRAAVIVKSDFPQEDMAPALVELYVYPINEDYVITSITVSGTDPVGETVVEGADVVVGAGYTETVTYNPLPPALPLGPNSNPWSTYDPNCGPGTWHFIEPA